MSEKYDVVVIGAGPGGYVAAVRAAQLGQNVAIIEKRKTLGGTCLNVGCIPSKALLDSSELFYLANKKFATHGIDIKKPKLNLKQMMKRKSDVVSSTTKGIDYLMNKNKITRLEGFGRFVDSSHIAIDQGKDSKVIEFKKCIIATGSDVATLPFINIDEKRVLSSTGALELTEVPKHLIVIGGGVIAVEMASIYARLGAEVTVIEFMDRIIPGMDAELSRSLTKSMKALGVSFYCSTKVTGVDVKKSTVQVTAEDKNGETVLLKGDYVLVAIGRTPYTEKLGLENVGINLDDRKRIDVNDHFQTSVPNIYAIGDVIKGFMLAHKASEEGSVCVEMMLGKGGHYNPDLVPGVVYTWPEVASVGKTEEELKQANISYKKGSFPFKASGRARAAEESEGFVKILSDSTTDEILGVHMIGPRCADLIAEAVLAMEYRASAEDLGMLMNPHPTFSEAIKEAALMATEKRAIHI
ncbi:dihydrolipoyl dehydrogenase [Candidatus Marinamargulisbacteria bacterium SCGC AG-410-N11]|nr:dihydrolipoyl dehydrogenase [Candidatus Marinamargulisbacteria bacterium SCGC AG-410-N11]